MCNSLIVVNKKARDKISQKKIFFQNEKHVQTSKSSCSPSYINKWLSLISMCKIHHVIGGLHLSEACYLQPTF